jgi:hypothetical protein
MAGDSTFRPRAYVRIEQQDLTQIRMAENQSRFREANEQIEATADRIGISGEVPFICECSDQRCTEIVRLSLECYEEVRSHPRRFFNAPRHEMPSVGAGAAVVVGERSGYVVVEKIDIAGDIADERYDQLRERQSDERT